MYDQMQQLFSKYNEKGFEILAFPCNQFGKQEPGTNEQIKKFAQTKGAMFKLFDKVNVNGKAAHPLFVYLRKELKGTLGSSVKWNFTKFLCNRQGKPVKRYAPNSKPLSFESDIVALLEEK
jgi:glutathione peroxidase-family protein